MFFFHWCSAVNLWPLRNRMKDLSAFAISHFSLLSKLISVFVVLIVKGKMQAAFNQTGMFRDHITIFSVDLSMKQKILTCLLLT